MEIDRQTDRQTDKIEVEKKNEKKKKKTKKTEKKERKGISRFYAQTDVRMTILFYRIMLFYPSI